MKIDNEEMDFETWCRLCKDEQCFSWDLINVKILSKDFVLEFREYLHPEKVNRFQQKWNRIDGIIAKFGSKFYIDTFDNYGYIDRW